MPKLRTLSGSEVQAILAEFSFRPVSQRGSHIKVRRVLEDGQTQTLTIPNHQEIDRGTLQPFFGRLAVSSQNLTCGASSSLNRSPGPEFKQH